MRQYILVLLLLAGCGTMRFKSKMNDWIGQPIDAAVQRYGAPNATYGTSYTFHFDNGATGRMTSSWGQPTIAITNHTCDITLTVGSTRLIEQWSSRGDCREGLIRSHY